LVGVFAAAPEVRSGREPLVLFRFRRPDVAHAQSLAQDQNASLPAGAVQTIHTSAMRSPSNR
jgi:hypothetical protein